MPADYRILAPIYDTIGLADYTADLIARLYDYAQSNFDFVGRKALDIGCGTGAVSRYLAKRGMNVIALDQSPEMLAIARSSLDTSGLGLQWLVGDARALPAILEEVDIAFALDMLNELNTLRDLETVFGQVYNALGGGKLFCLNLITIEGLAERGRASGLLHDDHQLTVFVQNSFDYDRQANTTRYTVFRRNGNLWGREEASQVLRGFPVQAVSALLQRIGFDIVALLTPTLQPFDPPASHADRVIWIVQKPE